MMKISAGEAQQLRAPVLMEDLWCGKSDSGRDLACKPQPCGSTQMNRNELRLRHLTAPRRRRMGEVEAGDCGGLQMGPDYYTHLTLPTTSRV